MFKTKEEFKYEFSKRIIETYGRTVEESHITEKFLVLELMVRDYASVNWATSKALIRNNNQKQMHYFSMEFLMGRLLVNNMMNLGIYDIAKEGLAEFGINIHDLEELESDAGLGNGGLGRLAACFMDSLASLAYPGHGHTIRYEFGLFKQENQNIVYQLNSLEKLFTMMQLENMNILIQKKYMQYLMMYQLLVMIQLLLIL